MARPPQPTWGLVSYCLALLCQGACHRCNHVALCMFACARRGVVVRVCDPQTHVGTMGVAHTSRESAERHDTRPRPQIVPSTRLVECPSHVSVTHCLLDLMSTSILTRISLTIKRRVFEMCLFVSTIPQGHHQYIGDVCLYATPTTKNASGTRNGGKSHARGFVRRHRLAMLSGTPRPASLASQTTHFGMQPAMGAIPAANIATHITLLRGVPGACASSLCHFATHTAVWIETFASLRPHLENWAQACFFQKSMCHQVAPVSVCTLLAFLRSGPISDPQTHTRWKTPPDVRLTSPKVARSCPPAYAI